MKLYGLFRCSLIFMDALFVEGRILYFASYLKILIYSKKHEK